MKCNVGGNDRIARVVLGVLILAAGAFFHNWLGAIGLVPLVTGAVGWCPLYLPIGFSTCGRKAAKAGR
jgi:hypothetical protein